MKLIAWNCNMAFRKKAGRILKEKPDILIVSECEHPDKLKFPKDVRLPSDIFWYGDNPHKGIAVCSYSDFKITPITPHHEAFKYIIPLWIENNNMRFVLLAIWCQKPENGDNYGAQLWRAIPYYQRLLDQDKVILAGDFNSNTFWDKPGRASNHTQIVKRLRENKIKSTYHQFFKEDQGQETQPTFYLYKNKNKPYHLDYCFTSTYFIDRLKKVKVGTHKIWKPYSDHSPVIVEFED